MTDSPKHNSSPIQRKKHKGGEKRDKKMSKENGKQSLESNAAGLNFEETKLTLGLPGKTRRPTEIGAKLGTKRGFSDTIDLNVESSSQKQSESDDNGAVIDEASVSKPPPAK